MECEKLKNLEESLKASQIKADDIASLNDNMNAKKNMPIVPYRNQITKCSLPIGKYSRKTILENGFNINALPYSGELAIVGEPVITSRDFNKYGDEQIIAGYHIFKVIEDKKRQIFFKS